MKPLRTGIALALTLMVFYSLCTLLWVALPDQFMNFMNSLFHGIDFRKLLVSSPYAWSSFFYVLIVYAIWGLAIGSFFAYVYNSLSQSELSELQR